LLDHRRIERVKTAKEQTKSQFDCNDVGILNEYVGCKIE